MSKYFMAVYFWFSILWYTGRAGRDLALVDIKSRFNKNVSRTDGAHHAGVRWASGIFNSMFPWWKLEIRGRENLLPNDEPSIFVCNHQSTVDIWALYFIEKPFRWISKQAIFYLPIIGYGMKMAGYIGVKRRDAHSRAEAFEQCEQALKSGATMLFFPEGTRSRDGELQRFRPGAFKLSEKLDVPIQPIVINGATKLLEKNSPWPGKATVHITILPPTTIRSGESIGDFTARIRDTIAKELSDMRARG